MLLLLFLLFWLQDSRLSISVSWKPICQLFFFVCFPLLPLLPWLPTKLYLQAAVLFSVIRSKFLVTRVLPFLWSSFPIYQHNLFPLSLLWMSNKTVSFLSSAHWKWLMWPFSGYICSVAGVLLTLIHASSLCNFYFLVSLNDLWESFLAQLDQSLFNPIPPRDLPPRQFFLLLLRTNITVESLFV